MNTPNWEVVGSAITYKPKHMLWTALVHPSIYEEFGFLERSLKFICGIVAILSKYSLTIHERYDFVHVNARFWAALHIARETKRK